MEADLTGKKNGRGAYLCRSAECLEKAIKIHALDRALDVRLDSTDVENIREILRGE